MSDVVTGDYGRTYDTDDHDEAIKAFFGDVLSGKAKLTQMGLIGSSQKVGDSDEEARMFRIAPALIAGGMLTFDQAQASFRAADLELSDAELRECVEHDKKWLGL